MTLSEDEIDKAVNSPKDGKSNFINGIGKNGDELVSLFEINAIVDDKENS